MTIQVGIVMDAIQRIKIQKDSSFAMLLAAQARGWTIHYMELDDLWLRDGEAYANMRKLRVQDDPDEWFSFLSPPHAAPLHSLDVILMRKDPPFDAEYLAATHLLELAEAAGALVINKPQSLRDANEKLFTAWFPQCCPPSLVSCNKAKIKAFLNEQRDIVLKPLDGMGGMSVFRVKYGDENTNVIIETITHNGKRFVMVQRYIPEIIHGDKRILMIDGEPVPYALARFPAEGELRGNLAAGGRGMGVSLSERDYWICQQVGAKLREKGLMFVGLDVIGEYLTEINVTSPTCIRELDKQYKIDIAGQLLDMIEAKLQAAG